MAESEYKIVKNPWWVKLEQAAYHFLYAGESRGGDSMGFCVEFNFGPAVLYLSRLGVREFVGRNSVWYWYDTKGRFVRRETVLDRAITRPHVPTIKELDELRFNPL